MNTLRQAVAIFEREERDRQTEGRHQVRQAVTPLVRRFRCDDPDQRAQAIHQLHTSLLPTVQDLVLDRLIEGAVRGTALLRSRSVRALQEIGKPAVSHLHFRLARSKQAGYRLRLVEVLASVVPDAAFKDVIALASAEFVAPHRPRLR